MSPHPPALFTAAILAVAPAVPGVLCINHEHWLNVDKVNRAELKNADGNEDHFDLGSCERESPPENGFNFRPCSAGLFTDKAGFYKRNDNLRFTGCDPHFVLVGDTCLNGHCLSGSQRRIPCGRSKSSFNPLQQLSLMQGGDVSSKGDSPWMTATYRTNWEQICGGTLITPSLVLTAPWRDNTSCFEGKLEWIMFLKQDRFGQTFRGKF